jgi:hypothetical protein
MSSVTPQSSRIKITLTPILERRVRDTQIAAGNVTPFSRFIVHLIERGLDQLDAELIGEEQTDEQEEA